MSDSDKVRCHKINSVINKWRKGKKSHSEVIKEVKGIVNDEMVLPLSFG